MSSAGRSPAVTVTSGAVTEGSLIDGSTVPSRSAIVSASVGMVGVLGYVGALLFAHLLDAPSYSDYAAAAMLLGMVGTFASALIPMPLTHVIRRHPPQSEERRRGLAFAWLVSAIAGAVAAVLTGAITATFAPWTVVAAVAFSAVTLFTCSPLWAWLHGDLRFVRAAVTSIAEVAARVLFSVAVILLGWGAGGALLGFAAGVAVVLAATPRALYRDGGWRPGVLRERARWAETGDIALAQLIASTLIGADVVLVAMLDAPVAEAAGYQALSTLAKGPVYVAIGAVIVAFPLLRSPRARIADILTAALRSFGLLALPAAAVVATVPTVFLLLVLPARYAGSVSLLPVLAAAGVGYATVTVFTTVLLGLRAYRRCKLGLLAAVLFLSASMLLGWTAAGVRGVAVGAAVGALTAAGSMWLVASPLLPPGTARRALRGLAATAVLLGLLTAARPVPALWTLAVAALGLIILRELRRRRSPETDDVLPAAPGGTGGR